MSRKLLFLARLLINYQHQANIISIKFDGFFVDVVAARQGEHLIDICVIPSDLAAHSI
jgi:hypothetical protein